MHQKSAHQSNHTHVCFCFMKLNSIFWSNDRAFSFFQEWHAFTVKEVEGTITGEEVLRYTYKLIFKQDLKEIRGWGLFTEREGLMQTGRYHFQILWTLPFQFLQETFDETTRSPVKTLRGYLSWIKNIDSTIHSFWCTANEKYLKNLEQIHWPDRQPFPRCRWRLH